MTHQSNQFTISIMSRDRIGIIAEVSGAISELEGDIADLRQSVLRGYFTMILLASFPAVVAAEQIAQRLTALNVEGKPALDIAVRPANDAAAADAPGVPDNAYVLTASGPDRIGFVATVSSFCAQNAINILDLSTAVDDGTYIMMLLVDLSCCNDLGALRDKLNVFGREMGLNVVLQHYDIFRATNEIKK
jgi:glycine cleavage system transcriptional repressor